VPRARLTLVPSAEAAAAALPGDPGGLGLGLGSRRARTLAGLALLAVLALTAAAATVLPNPEGLFIRFAGLAAAGGLAFLSWRVDPVYPLSAGIVATVFSGNWDQLGFPIGADRILLVTGIASVLLRARDEGRRLRFEPVHGALIVAGLWAASSAFVAGTIRDPAAFWGLLDRVGIIPFAVFAVAPLAFRTERQRQVLLGALVLTGGYLGFTALAETLGARGLIFPTYISNEAIGIHQDRARGPFVEAVANGMGLYASGVAAAIAVVTWKRPRWRLVALGVLGLCAIGIVFTLTRAIWLASAVATLAAMMATPQLRRFVVPTMAAGAGLVIAMLALVPGLQGDVAERQADKLPIYDRLNTNAAGLRMLEEKPLFGQGWQTFADRSRDYLWQNDDYPLTGVGIDLHNVFLSHAVELGLLGFLAWIIAWGWGIGGAIISRGPPELTPWRTGLIALAVHWVIVGNLGPLGYALPTLLLWSWAAVVWAGRYDARDEEPVAAAARA
jgi:putative inorganic carbon (hco3(-)) transporter